MKKKNIKDEVKIPEVELHYIKGSEVAYNEPIQNSAEAVEIFRQIIKPAEIQVREQMVTLFLNDSNKVLGYYRHSIGGISGTLVDIRLILAAALKSLCVRIIICHNHPSGNLKPSIPDGKITIKLRDAASEMDIQLIDHIILTKEGYYSYSDEGHLSSSFNGVKDQSYKMKTPITYYGGKQTMLKHLLELIPAHAIYCEPFFGGGALFFAKPKSEVEIINDINREVVNFFKVVKTKFTELQKEINSTLHSRELYKDAMVVYEHPNLFPDVKRAWALWTLTNQGFAGMIGSWGFGKTNSKEKSLSNKRDDFTKAYSERLKTVQVENNDALKVIDRCDSKDTFFYCDPPYIGSDMGHYKGYSEEDYKALLTKLSKVKGKFLLSSYPSPILNQFIKKYKWKTKRIEKSIAVTKHTDKKKTEVLIFNYDPDKIKRMETMNGINESPAVIQARKDAEGYKNLPLVTLKIIYRLEKDAELEYGLLPEIIIRKYALEKAIAQKKKTMNGEKNKNSYSEIGTEIQFIRRFLSVNDQIIYKKTLEIFIDELQKAIQEKKITKKSPVAKEINAIQQAVINAFNSMKNAKHFILKPSTVRHLKGIIEKYENAYDDLDETYIKTKKKEIGLSGIDNQVNIMPSTDFANIQFNSIGFTGKYLDFMGDPAPGFTAMVFGMPKMGKSYLCVDFAGYLAHNHGKVLYVAKEEKLDATLQKKLKDKNVAHENLFVADALPKDLSAFDFIFLDSVNKLGLTPKDIEKLKADNKGKSFVFVFQATKGGSFKGNNEFQHDVDVVIEVPEQGKAVQYGRFNQGGELDIFPDHSKDLTSKENVSMLAGIKNKKMNKKNKTESFPAWTHPKHLDANDHAALKHIYSLWKEGEMAQAMDYAMSRDTVIREEIPGEIWRELGGKLTKTGEEKLRKAS